MYYTVHIMFIGTLFLLGYILVDWMKNGKTNMVKRIIFYSFIFYGLNVAQLTLGSLTFPPQSNFITEFNRVQLIPFYFVWDLVMEYKTFGLGWGFWNAAKLSFYNVIMLFPLGVYLSMLFKMNSARKATLVVFLVSLTIETTQLIGGFIGLVERRTFNLDDLMLNTLGGVIGFMVFEWIRKNMIKKQNHKYHTNY